MRQEQEEMIENLQRQVINLEQAVDQTTELDDLQTLDQTYEVNHCQCRLLFPPIVSPGNECSSRNRSSTTQFSRITS